MIIAFISKEFLQNIGNSKGIAKNFNLFDKKFFCSLNLDFVVSDIDLNSNDCPLACKLNDDLMTDGKSYRVKFIPDSLEESILNNPNFFAEYTNNDLFKLLFVHLPISLFKIKKQLQYISAVSSIDFEASFNNFLIQDKIENKSSLDEYLNNNKDAYNPFECCGNNFVLVDEPYFLIKDRYKVITDIRIDEKHYKNKIKEFVLNFIPKNRAKCKKIIFLIPTFINDNSKLKWTQKEREKLVKLATEALNQLMPSTIIIFQFHKLNSHSRFLLCNKQIYSLGIGFDFISNPTKLKETNDCIEFKSIYMKYTGLETYYENRISQLNIELNS